MTTRLPFTEVQKGIYTILATPLGALSPAYAVYSWTAPHDATFPYVILSALDSAPRDTKDSATHDIVATIDAYSDSPSASSVNDAMDAILTALSGGALSLTGNFSDIGVSFQESCNLFTQYLEAEDKALFHGVVRYHWVVEDENA